MATEVEYVNYKDFVADLESTENPGVDDVTVVSNSADGPRTIPANTSALTNTATDSDLTAAASLELQTATGKKKAYANLFAKQSGLESTDGNVTALTTYVKNVAASIAPPFDATRTSENPYKAGEPVTYTDGKVYVFTTNHYGEWDANDVRLSSVSEIVENSSMESKTDTFSYTSSGIGQEWRSYAFSYSGKAGKQYRFTVASNDDTASTNVNGMYLRLKDTSNAEHDIIPMNATEWVFEGSVEYDFVAVVIKFKKILSSYTYSIECVEKGLEEVIEALAEKVDNNYETLDDKIDDVADDVSSLETDVAKIGASVNPTTISEDGKNNTYIHHSLMDIVVPGKKYKFKLPQTTWELATNSEAYPVIGFSLSYNTGGAETYVEQAMIAPGASSLSKTLESEYTLNVPSNVAGISIGLRAKSGVTVQFTLDPNMDNDIEEQIDELDGRVDGLEDGVSDLQADVTNIYKEIPRTFTEAGKNNTYINHNITDLVIPGKKYKFKLPQTSWELATNTEVYNVQGFVISYNTGGSETYVEQATIASGKDYFNKDLKSEYTINVPSDLASLKFGLRAKSGVNVEFKLELDESDEYDILHMYPRVRMLPRVGVMKRKTPYGYSANNTPKALLWVSDIHGIAANVERIEKFRKEYSSFIDDVLNTGDSVGDNLGDYSQYETMLAKGADKWLVAVGNHDVTHQGSSYKGWGAEDTIASIYEKFVGQMNVTGVQGATNKNYYYKDYTGGNGSCKAVRLIVLDSCINPSSVTASHSGVSGAETEAYYGDQLTWFQVVLADAVTNSLAVVVATHYVNATVELLSSTGFTSMSGVGNTVACTMSGDYLDAVDTFIGNGGEFVTWLAGHAHQDHIGVLDGHPNQLVIHINRGSARNDGNAESVGLYRPSGEITEATDAFNCISFDTYYKRIRMVRVGCNLDNFGRPMDMICIDYGNKKIIDPVVDAVLSAVNA